MRAHDQMYGFTHTMTIITILAFHSACVVLMREQTPHKRHTSN